MTCIVGLTENGKVYIGADSSASGRWEIRVTNLPKVFEVGDFIIGYTGSFRMGQILQFHLDIPTQGEESDEEYLVRVFVESVRKQLKEYGYAKVENNQEEGGNFLVGYKGKLFSFGIDFQINTFADNLDAAGAGREYALGAMLALTGLDPEERIKKSLEIGSQFSPYVMAPFTVLSGSN